jgi:plasmid replication initiation protein
MNTDLKPREYVIQPNAISQSIYSASTFARRLMAMAMSLLPFEFEDESDYTVMFSASDFLKSLGTKEGTQTRKLAMAAVDECVGCLVKILDEKSNKYIVFPWFVKAELDMDLFYDTVKGEDVLTMKFNPELAEAIGDFRQQYAKIDLLDFGKLQGKYAIRIYELALSYHGYAGKDGNRQGEWFFQKSVEDIRLLFDIDPKKYKTTGNFRTRIIDNPIEEINAAGIGLRIEPDYIRRGKRLMGIRFNCRWVEKGEPLPVTPATETEQEEERLKNAYPEEFEKLYAESFATKSQTELFKDHPEWIETTAKAEAIAQLKALHPQPRRYRGW